jgi:membrane associated rhomboid family serine protease
MNNSILDDIKTFYTKSDVLNRFIAINVSVFLLVSITKVVLFLMGSQASFVFLDYLKLPSNLITLLYRPWTIISHMFYHEGFFHILFNMLMLFWYGRIFQEFLGNRRFQAIYLLGGIFGGLIFVLAYNIFPVFDNVSNVAKAFGASASVLAVIVATATYLPNYTIGLMFIGPVRLKYIAMVLVLLDVIFIPDGNPGGHIGHLGGALTGFLYAKGLTKGYDASIFIEKVLNAINIFKKKQPKMRATYTKAYSTTTANSKNTTFKKTGYKDFDSMDQRAKQEKIDEILDKISESGYESLSKEEKDMLFNISKKI